MTHKAKEQKQVYRMIFKDKSMVVPTELVEWVEKVRYATRNHHVTQTWLQDMANELDKIWLQQGKEG